MDQFAFTIFQRAEILKFHDDSLQSFLSPSLRLFVSSSLRLCLHNDSDESNSVPVSDSRKLEGRRDEGLPWGRRDRTYGAMKNGTGI